MATGESYRSLGFQYRINESYVSAIVQKVLMAIIKKKWKESMPKPTEETWKIAAHKFWQRWNFPMCVGAIDGKHVRIQCPPTSGSLFYNYKGYFSTVLFALVDAEYKFIAIDVGSYGREGDASIFHKSPIGKKIKNNAWNLPQPKNIPSTDIVVPHVFLGDQAFSLQYNLMTPYSQKKIMTEFGNTMSEYNRRHSRARRVVENAFGILNNCWRIFNTPINAKTTTIDKIVIACCILHNMLRKQNITILTDTELPELTNPCLVPLERSRGRNHNVGIAVRENFTTYYNSAEGKLPFMTNLLQ